MNFIGKWLRLHDTNADTCAATPEVEFSLNFQHEQSEEAYQKFSSATLDVTPFKENEKRGCFTRKHICANSALVAQNVVLNLFFKKHKPTLTVISSNSLSLG